MSRFFTCAACGGQKYNHTPTVGPPPGRELFCEDCYANGALDTFYQPQALQRQRSQGGKPGLHEVLMSVWEADYAAYSSFEGWVTHNGGSEEATAKAVQDYLPNIWQQHYHKITGEYWK